MHQEDDILVRRTLCGDKSAFALLVERYQGVVYRIAYREVGNHHDAEDIAQEAFLKAYRKLKTLKDPNVFPSWLYAITVNLCKSWWRKRKREVETTELSEAPLELATWQLYAQQEQKTTLWNAVMALAEKDRRIMTMFYRDGYSTQEIGEQMGITQNQVLVRLHRARQKLKEEFIMAHQTYASGEMQPTFIEQVMNALPKQYSAPWHPIISLGLGKSAALVTATIVALAIGFGSLLHNETSNEVPPPITPRSDEAMGVFLFTASDQQLSLGISALQTATEGKEHKLPAGQPGAVVWGKGRDIEGIVQIAEPVYHGGSLWATQTAPKGYEKWVNERSKIKLSFLEKQIPLSSEELFKQPLLLISGNKPVELNEAERENLRKYLAEKGGLLVVDEVPGEPGGFVSSIQKILKELLPDSQTIRVKNELEIYNLYYEMGGPPAGVEEANKKYLEGTFLNGNLLALYSDRNYWQYLMEDTQDLTEEEHKQVVAIVEASQKLKKPLPDWLIQIGKPHGAKRFFCNVLIYAITRGNIADYSEYVP
jgi:RNA polymerase sigma-70 factor (ECF subfamily)